MNFIKRLIYKRKRNLVAKRIAQRKFNKISIDCFDAIKSNFDVKLVEKIQYGYKYKQISIIKIIDTDGTYEGTEEYCLLSIGNDKIKSKYNYDIFNFLKMKWDEFKDTRIYTNIQSL